MSASSSNLSCISQLLSNHKPWLTCSLEIKFQKVLVGHRAAVNVVDFDEKYIVSASGDRTIKVWTAQTGEFVRTLQGHRRGIGKSHFFRYS